MKCRCRFSWQQQSRRGRKVVFVVVVVVTSLIVVNVPGIGEVCVVVAKSVSREVTGAFQSRVPRAYAPARVVVTGIRN